MHTPVCTCNDCEIERHGLVGKLRLVAAEQEADWIDTHYDPWLLKLAADRIEKLEAECDRLAVPAFVSHFTIEEGANAGTARFQADCQTVVDRCIELTSKPDGEK